MVYSWPMDAADLPDDLEALKAFALGGLGRDAKHQSRRSQRQS
jgi:hypothetical protein